jgi:nucleotide-binding universal stress UspA family protein
VITPIVAAADGSDESLAATEWAAVAAARRHLPLCIVHVVDLHPGPATHGQLLRHELAGPFHHELPHHARSVLARAAHRAAWAAPGIDMHAVAVYGHADQVLTAITARTPLLALGTRGAGRLPGQRLGSVALRLADQAKCPVVLVTADSSPAFQEIVVGTDGSDDATAAFEFGFFEADLRNSRLTALYIWAYPQAGDLENFHDWMLSVGPVNPLAAARLAEEVTPWRRRYPSVLVRENTVHGQPGRVLTLASGHADLIVVDRDTPGQAQGLGPVSDALLHHAQCPVAVIPGLVSRLASTAADARWSRVGGAG